MPGGLVGELVLLTGPEKGLGLFLHSGQFYVVGSMDACDLGLSGEGVGERHCRIMVGSGLITLEDLRTPAGTLINGQRVQLAELSFGDHVRVGDQVIRVDERSDAFAPPQEILEVGGWCQRCRGPIVVGEYSRPEVYREVDGKLCSPCAERELAESGRMILSLRPGTAGDEGAGARELEEGEPEVIAGRYAVVANAGSGQLGTVYEAWDARTNSSVAVKMLHRRFKEDPASFARLIEMGQRVMHLEHPWVARPITIGDDPSGCYVVSEFVEGQDLWKRIEAEGPFPIEETIRLGIALSDALELIHVKGMVHGDLKPSNLLVTAEDRIKITDVGIARACLGTGLAVVTEHLIPRTLAFHAPELLLEEREADVRSDVYSLGAVLYCLLAGGYPYAEFEEKELPRRIVVDRPASITQWRPEIHRELAVAIEKAMNKSAGARHPSAGELGQALMDAWL